MHCCGFQSFSNSGAFRVSSNEGSPSYGILGFHSEIAGGNGH